MEPASVSLLHVTARHKSLVILEHKRPRLDEKGYHTSSTVIQCT
jgi:hypothetical protein